MKKLWKDKNGKLRIKVLLAVLALIVILALLLLPRLFPGDGGDDALTLGDTTLLTLGDMENSISAGGTVESADSVAVYSSLSYPVEEVLVEVGDTVKEGQLLARLDGQNVQDQITSQQIGLQNSRTAADQQVKVAQENYYNYKKGIDEGLNTTLINAQAQVDTAQENYEKALDNYERYKQSVKDGENTSLLNAESSQNAAKSALSNAKSAYNSAKTAYDAAKKAYEDAETAYKQDPENAALKSAFDAADTAYDKANATYTSAKNAYDNAQTAYDTAKALYEATDSSVHDALDDYESAVNTAKRSYDVACEALEAAKKSVDEQLLSYENNLNSALLAANTDLTEETIRQLRVTLSDTEIKAPCAGTVTAVYAKVGASGLGILFVIEDLDRLIVKTTVKDYDLGTVRVGMKVLITSDATGDREINGTVTKIAPAANKTAQGETDTSGDALFAVEISVDEAESGLYVGTEAQLDYIVDAESNVLTVPYDAVYENAEERDCVLAAEEQTGGGFLISELPVTVGLANDLDVVVSGDGLREGLRVINEPEKYLSLLGKTVSIGDTPKEDEMPVGMGGM